MISWYLFRILCVYRKPAGTAVVESTPPVFSPAKVVVMCIHVYITYIIYYIYIYNIHMNIYT